MRTDFNGGVAVITGAASGIGAGLVTEAVSLGMRVALADTDEGSIRARAGELERAGAEVIWRRVDVRSASDLENLRDDVYARWGRTTLLVNNAGVELHGNTWEVPHSEWRRIIDINLNGVFNGIRAFVPSMMVDETPSHVVVISSVAALRTNPGTSAYAATKHGNLALTECLALELAPVAPQIRVSAVLPGAVHSSIFESAYVADTEAGKSSRETLSAAVEAQGIPPEEAARIILDGVAEGLLHIHTDPDTSRNFIAARAAHLAL